jgi:hypothetical protein
MDLDDAQNEKNRGQIILELTYKPFKEDNLPKELTDEAVTWSSSLPRVHQMVAVY